MVTNVNRRFFSFWCWLCLLWLGVSTWGEVEVEVGIPLYLRLLRYVSPAKGWWNLAAMC